MSPIKWNSDGCGSLRSWPKDIISWEFCEDLKGFPRVLILWVICLPHFRHTRFSASSARTLCRSLMRRGNKYYHALAGVSKSSLILAMKKGCRVGNSFYNSHFVNRKGSPEWGEKKERSRCRRYTQYGHSSSFSHCFILQQKLTAKWQAELQW